MIDAIYASKLYRSSKRKSAIVAAANDPINTELVTQLVDALSPVYKKDEYLVDKSAQEKKAAARLAREREAHKDDVSDEPSKTSHRAPSHIADSFRAAANHEPDSAVAEKPVEPDSLEDSADSKVEESIQTSAEPVTASARLLTIDMKQQVDQIKSLLNLAETTSGVNRILVKDSELWVYYNDSINLNNVMADAIESLNAAGYTYLEFNRLARSDNAIVFQIYFKDTDAEIKPKSEEDNDEKGN